MRVSVGLVAGIGALLLLLLTMVDHTASSTASVIDCDVVVVGGSVSGMSSAITSAKEGAKTCLIVPTDMVGGQMTANGIPALDFSQENGNAPFNTTGAPPDTMQANWPKDFSTLLESLPPPNYRHTCWVSQYCFLPTHIEAGGIKDLLDEAGPNLHIFLNTVLLNASVVPFNGSDSGNGSQSSRISGVTAIQRTPTAATSCNGYGTRLSATIRDWYSPLDSANYTKSLIDFRSDVWIDSSYNGELLVLAKAPYLQGIDEAFDGDTRGTAGNDTIGQSFTMTFQIVMHNDTVPQNSTFLPSMDRGWAPNPFQASPAVHNPSHRLSWSQLWTRRRSYHAESSIVGNRGTAGSEFGMDPPAVNNISAGDVMLNAWPDFYYGYIFSSKNSTMSSVGTSTWVGGYDVSSIEGSERYSYGAFLNYTRQAPDEWKDHMSLDSSSMGTCHGFSKMPYIRDGRRLIGIDDFVISINFTENTQHQEPSDCIALAGHGFDFWGHRMVPFQDSYPPYMQESGTTGNICVPLRALTSKSVSNLIGSGYTMAQSFMINAALRLHPEEFNIGVGAGVAGAFMSANKISSTAQVLAPSNVAAIQNRILKHAPLKWTLGPSPGPNPWPAATGFKCAEVFNRCVQVEGGGMFNNSNTFKNCSYCPSCPPLGNGEWLAIAGSVRMEGNASATFLSSTRIKKSTINSSLLPGDQVLNVAAGQSISLVANLSLPFKADKYEYVLLRCSEINCKINL